MIKHDTIPKEYKKRYLLSDFGYVEMDELDSILFLFIFIFFSSQNN